MRLKVPAMSGKKQFVGYAVYWPPLPGLPFLAVIFLPDGKAEARQFETADSAEAYTREMAKGLAPPSSKH